MQNTANKKIVPTPKTLMNAIASSDDIKATAAKLKIEASKVYNVLSGNNKKDELEVLKAMKNVIQKRLKEEQKVLEKVIFIKEENN